MLADNSLALPERKRLGSATIFLRGLSMANVQEFGAWLSDFADGKRYLAFKFLSGDTLSLFGDFHFGSGFIAGNLSEDPADGRAAVRYDAIASVTGR